MPWPDRRGSVLGRAEDVLIVARTARSLFRVGRMLRSGGFPRALDGLALEVQPTAAMTDGPAPPGTAHRVRVALSAVRLPGERLTCLHKALSLQQVLGSLGVASSVVVGVKEGEAFAAHAWLATAWGPIDPNGLDLGAYGEVGRFAPAEAP